MDLHPHCAPLEFLLGTWRGAGAGSYPTIDSFAYNEEVVFGHAGKPFLSYSQKTKRTSTGEPLHAESGFLRAGEDGSIEFVVVQPSGIIEMHHGRANGNVLDLTLDAVHVTATAKSVTDVTRRFEVVEDGDERSLVYDVAMAAVGQPLTHHLNATLIRQPT